MTSPRETINKFCKAYKLTLPSTTTIMTSYIFSHMLKASLAICMLATTCLFFYITISTQSQLLNCPECHKMDTHQKYRDTKNVQEYEEQETNISHVLFGIGGTTSTWHKRSHYSELWWKPNITRGFVWLDKNPFKNQTWSNKSPPYKVSADTRRFKYTCWYGNRSAIRIARIVKESFELDLDNVRWFVMGDDDTVFFVENLVTVLGKYDHTKMFYVGSISESIEQDLVHSFSTGYGGAGFAISYPLAAELVKTLDGCIDRYSDAYGSDQKIAACMTEIGVSLTTELGFHQLDIRGSPYGYLAAHPLAPLVSLHHLDYVDPLFPNMTRNGALKKLKTAYDSDPGRTLQQSYCYDLKRNWTISASWGYSIQLYPSLMKAKDLSITLQTFKTWNTRRTGPFTFNTQLLARDPCVVPRPIFYYLDRVRMVGPGRTLTIYQKFVDFEDPYCDDYNYTLALAVQSIHVYSSTFNPNLWKKAPRRQCCEVIDGTDAKKGNNNSIGVKIRSCRSFESVSPP